MNNGYQQTASRLHAFNRYEIKYFVDEMKVPELRRELAARMDTDPYSPHGGYPVTSLYYDTPDLRFYWEKIEGLKFRRKVRMRLYGDPAACTDDSPVQVEIKQRVNRVTQKRRTALPYGVALRWLNGREDIECDDSQRPFVDEVSGLVGNLDLRPIVTTGYLREAFVGRDADLGLRVTIDHKVHGRDRDFHFASGAENRFIIPPKLAVVELKANERVPYWATDLTARLDMSVIRVSKYCQSVEAFGLAPRSRFGAPELVSPDGSDARVPTDLLSTEPIPAR
ncbi:MULTISPECIES: polyphosphate polymerase domain-containing protein [Rhodococcus]|uniref:Polyphosphate polymerase domain-containing protein n=1 Tax=Rhodococcus sp. D-6 TaxID=1387842 RepID=A0AAU7USQ7_9NOCA|nr:MULTISPECIES: polyphosphate polymerase domain-containing protein [Rhodococcus]AWZ26490.1 vacuolar transporter [Rhodococcus pyridinivorans]KHJ72915.1 vacuolar transporter [Rhodococcus sp. Chr-9]MCD2119170.1 polyphosphate polymerase domain-containing protein [Rhodococcus pyridinivorans]MCD2141505.1 polyphosphate polymerase domain-containing protein [Rhodococcus pyridinivorans]MCW3468097.1 polyphosphate polymerase domain-containing protein [Rhodococcus pyridinivorans]